MKDSRFAARTGSLIIGLICFLSGCSLLYPGPGATVNKFYESVEAGQIDEALKLLATSFRSQFGDQKLKMALAEQARQIKAQQQGIRSITTQHEEIQGQLATVTTSILFGNGTARQDVTKLILEDHTWKISPSK